MEYYRLPDSFIWWLIFCGHVVLGQNFERDRGIEGYGSMQSVLKERSVES